MSAIRILIESHPEEMLINWREWFGGVVEGLWDVPRKGMTVRWKTSMVLAGVVEARLRSWRGDGSGEKRNRVGDEISEEFLVSTFPLCFLGFLLTRIALAFGKIEDT